MAPGNYKSRQQYDSLLKLGAKKHNWIERQLVYKNFDLKEKYGSDPKLILPALGNKFMHLIPQMLFYIIAIICHYFKTGLCKKKTIFLCKNVW